MFANHSPMWSESVLFDLPNYLVIMMALSRYENVTNTGLPDDCLIIVNVLVL